jgi:ribosomal protein S18 acetylase RimI-like enzyme
MQDIRIENLTFSDYEEVFSFWNSCDGLHMHHDHSETPEGFLIFLERNLGLCFVARDGKKIIGAVLGSHDGRRGFINHMAVSSAYRKKGIGRMLVHNVIESLKSVGIRKILIFVLKNSPDAQAFWKHMGFLKEDIIDIHSLVV